MLRKSASFDLIRTAGFDQSLWNISMTIRWNCCAQKRLADGPGSSASRLSPLCQECHILRAVLQEEELEELYEHWQMALEAKGVSMDDTWGGFDDRELEKMKNFRHALPDILNEIFRERKRQLSEYP